MSNSELTRKIIGCAMKVHSALGPGLLESAYQQCLYYELAKSGLKIEKEKKLPIFYDSVEIDCNYRIDLLVEDQVLIELKSVAELSDIHTAQTITYLKLGDFRTGLLINFNERSLRNGIKRIVNNI